MKGTEEIAFPSLQLSFQLIKELKRKLEKKLNFPLKIFSRYLSFVINKEETSLLNLPLDRNTWRSYS